MSLKTKVKVSNITNLSDARYCAGMGVDMLGFAISEVEGQGISKIKFKEITNWISGPEFVLEVHEEAIHNLDEESSVDLIELPASQIENLLLTKSKHRYLIRVDLLDWPQYKANLLINVEAINCLLVYNLTGLNNLEAKRLIEEMSTDFSVLLGFEIKIALLDEYLTWPIAGLSLNGSEELSPGIKDYDHLSLILEKLEVD